MPGYPRSRSNSFASSASTTCPTASRRTLCRRPAATISHSSTKGRIPAGSNIRSRRLRGFGLASTFVDIAVEELRPSYMRGSGAVPEDAVAELNGVVHELRSLVAGMERYLRLELGTDLEKRLQQLERSGLDMDLLRSLEQIVTRNGFVEFRPRIDALASRLEDDSFEVALFGRVSCGKSSLLNAILGTAVLPVGVNPI